MPPHPAPNSAANSTALTPPPPPGEVTDLATLDRAQMAAQVDAFGMPPYRSKQLWNWIYSRGVTDFAAMTNLSKADRADLARRSVIGRLEISRHLISNDGTQKWLLRLHDGHQIESVYIPEDETGALCLSAQVGCTLNCQFCHTGTQRLVRNLSAAEIVGQLLLARDGLDDWHTPDGQRHVRNIVMMGMGEPLYNYDNVARALKVIMDPEGIAISRRRITLSTAGVVPMMARCGREIGVNLAVSLHAVTDELRDRIVPLNRKYPIAELMAACRTYPGARNARRITFEYVMLKGVNDSIADAKALVQLIRGIPAKINLIPFNSWPGAPFERSTDTAIERFAEVVRRAGYPSPVRTPRGNDILAACGQLKSASQRVRRTATASTEKPITPVLSA